MHYSIALLGKGLCAVTKANGFLPITQCKISSKDINSVFSIKRCIFFPFLLSFWVHRHYKESAERLKSQTLYGYCDTVKQFIFFLSCLDFIVRSC